VHEVADYAELECWRYGNVSITAVARRLGRHEENDYNRGIPDRENAVMSSVTQGSEGGVPEEEAGPLIVEAAYREIEQRIDACGDGYPFSLQRSGYDLSEGGDGRHHRQVVYRFLLLATRLNMRSKHVHADIDGTELFEKLAAETAREYLGNRAESFAFGTASDEASFSARVNDLCERLQEGGEYLNRTPGAPVPRDGKVDLAAWKSFRDGLPGKVIAFGQCKTGTNWRDEVTQLQPDSFCGKWVRDPVHIPVRMFFISEAPARSRWYAETTDAGVLFDRCRVVDYSHCVDCRVFDQVVSWTKAAAEATGLPWRW